MCGRPVGAAHDLGFTIAFPPPQGDPTEILILKYIFFFLKYVCQVGWPFCYNTLSLGPTSFLCLPSLPVKHDFLFVCFLLYNSLFV